MPRQTDLIPVVALVLENHQGKVLIQQRKKGSHLAGFWEFPGGKVESHETHKQALIREIQEELNYTPSNFQHFIKLTHCYPNKTIELTVYYEKENSPLITSAENQPLIWVEKEALLSYQMPDADIPIINKLLSKQ